MGSTVAEKCSKTAFSACNEREGPQRAGLTLHPPLDNFEEVFQFPEKKSLEAIKRSFAFWDIARLKKSSFQEVEATLCAQQ